MNKIIALHWENLLPVQLAAYFTIGLLILWHFDISNLRFVGVETRLELFRRVSNDRYITIQPIKLSNESFAASVALSVIANGFARSGLQYSA